MSFASGYMVTGLDTVTSITFRELYDHGKYLAANLDRAFDFSDGQRIVEKTLIDIGIDPRQTNVSLPMSSSVLRNLDDRIKNIEEILQFRAISNRNIKLAMEYAGFRLGDKKKIHNFVRELGFDPIQFEDDKGTIGLKASRLIEDSLARFVNDPEFGINKGKYAPNTNVLSEAATLAKLLTNDITTFLYLSSGLTRNYFNNCWGTTAIVNSNKIDGMKTIYRKSADIIWADIIGVRPTIHEYGYTLGLFQKSIFEVLGYFKRTPKLLRKIMREIGDSSRLLKEFSEFTKDNLLTVCPTICSTPIKDLILLENGSVYRYNLQGNTVLRTRLGQKWEQIADTEEIESYVNEGRYTINGITFGADTSHMVLQWYESRPQSKIARFWDYARHFPGKIVESYARSRYLKEVYMHGMEAKAFADSEADRIEKAKLKSELKLATAQLEEESRLRLQAEEEKRVAMEAALRNEKLAAVGLLGSSFAHEINNPLAAAGTHLRVSKALIERDPRRAIESLDQAIASVDLAKSVVSTFRGSTSLSEEKNGYNLNLLCQDALRINPYLKQGYVVNTEYKEDLPLVYCNKTEIIQLLTNLYNNAFEAMKDKEDKQLEIITESDDKYSIIKIKDTGGGISEENMLHLFTPFFTTKKQQVTGTGGTGLGLYRCMKIVEELRGELSFENYFYDTNKKGVEFKIKIPFWGE